MLSKSYINLPLLLQILGSRSLPPALDLPDTIASRDGEYKTYPFVWGFDSDPHQSSTPPNVCLAVHLPLHHISTLPWLLESWEGHISVAVYVYQSDFSDLYAAMSYLQKCYPHATRRLSLHVLTEKDGEPDAQSYGLQMDDVTCEFPEEVLNTVLFGSDDYMHMLSDSDDYPVNYQRNVAARYCNTPYVLSVDGSIVPSRSLYKKLNDFLGYATLSGKKEIFVLPTYEVDMEWETKLPANVKGLLQFIKKEQAIVHQIIVS